MLYFCHLRGFLILKCSHFLSLLPFKVSKYWWKQKSKSWASLNCKCIFWIENIASDIFLFVFLKSRTSLRQQISHFIEALLCELPLPMELIWWLDLFFCIYRSTRNKFFLTRWMGEKFITLSDEKQKTLSTKTSSRKATSSSTKVRGTSVSYDRTFSSLL